MMPLAIAVAVTDEGLWQEIHSALLDLPVRTVFEQAGIGELPAFLEKIERLRPDAVLLDLAALPCELPLMVEAISAAPGSPFVVVVNREGRQDLILDALRAGAKEYLFPPLKPTLEQALVRLGGERERIAVTPRRTGRLVGFLSAKGGCGATTLACHSAAILEKETGKATLLCDLDLSSGLVRFLMHSQSRYSVVDACANVHRLDRSYWQALISNGCGHLDVISGPEAAPLKEMPGGQQIRQVLRFARSEYDWVMADLGSGLCPTSYSAIEELDDLFLVTTPDVPALHQAKRITQQLLAHGLARNALHLVLNRLSRKTEVSPSELEDLLGLPFYATLTDHDHALHEAYSEARLLPLESPLAREISGLVCKLADLPLKQKRRFALFG
jgi:pilus assembly protein CpaE